MQDLAKKLTGLSPRPPCCVVIHTTDRKQIIVGSGDPVLSVRVRNKRGEKALLRLSQLEICEAYIRGDLDFDGDLITASSFQSFLSDSQFWIKFWRRLKPLLIGRRRCNADWIAKHYNEGNVQLLAADRDYQTYTPGIYTSETDTLEAGAVRKLEGAFHSLKLGDGLAALDVGCGWGGFVRYCAARNVRVTGITLSRDQLEFANAAVKGANVQATILYQDFFAFRPHEKYDGIALMGVLEDLSDYRAVMTRLTEWVKPRGRVYLDFAAARQPFGTSSFITKYIWPGLFRMVYLPELISAIWHSPFEIVELHNDRRNYHLWARQSYSRWIEQKTAVIERASEQLWRTFRIMHAGTANVMSDSSDGVTAHRMVLERPAR
jgi:cyclopropane-fatty-acyl-phospholipid synthase